MLDHIAVRKIRMLQQQKPPAPSSQYLSRIGRLKNVGQHMEKIIIVGSAGQARVAIDIVERAQRYQIVGLLDRFRAVGARTMGYDVLGAETDIERLRQLHQLDGMLVAIGDNFVRAEVSARLCDLAPTLPFVAALHPAAQIGRNVVIGAGTLVMAGACINPGCTVGVGCVVNTLSSLDHDSVMGDYATLAPRAATGGNCTIGSGAFVGMGALLLQRVQIGAHALIGAGAVVLRSVPEHAVAHGNPARVRRYRRPDEPYLHARAEP